LIFCVAFLMFLSPLDLSTQGDGKATDGRS
jgi:hypothetical protein